MNRKTLKKRSSLSRAELKPPTPKRSGPSRYMLSGHPSSGPLQRLIARPSHSLRCETCAQSLSCISRSGAVAKCQQNPSVTAQEPTLRCPDR